MSETAVAMCAENGCDSGTALQASRDLSPQTHVEISPINFSYVVVSATDSERVPPSNSKIGFPSPPSSVVSK